MRVKEKRRAREKAAIFLENIYVIMTRMLVEIWMLKAILVWSQTEIRNVSLETREKAILVIKWQRTWLKGVLVFCGR